jgi:hypothetical protein
VHFDNLREAAPTYDHIVVEFGEVGYAYPFGSGEIGERMEVHIVNGSVLTVHNDGRYKSKTESEVVNGHCLVERQWVAEGCGEEDVTLVNSRCVSAEVQVPHVETMANGEVRKGQPLQ